MPVVGRAGLAHGPPSQAGHFALSLEVRSGYRIQANQQDDSMRVLYYMEKELANFDPSRPGPANGRVERGEKRALGLEGPPAGWGGSLPTGPCLGRGWGTTRPDPGLQHQ